MSRRKETVPNTCLYRRRRSRLSVGQHAFEINGGVSSVFFSSTQSHNPSVHGSFRKREWSARCSGPITARRGSQRTAGLGDVLSGPGTLGRGDSSSLLLLCLAVRPVDQQQGELALIAFEGCWLLYGLQFLVCNHGWLQTACPATKQQRPDPLFSE